MSILGSIGSALGFGGGGGSSSSASSSTQTTTTSNLGNSSSYAGPATILNGNNNTVTDGGAVASSFAFASDALHTYSAEAQAEKAQVANLALQQTQLNHDTLASIGTLADNIKTGNSSQTLKIVGTVLVFIVLGLVLIEGKK